MKRSSDRQCIPAADYARELGVSPEEVVGLIKTHYYYGELRNGEWFVEPNSNRPKSTVGRLFWFMGGGFALGVTGNVSRVVEQNFGQAALLDMGKWAGGLALVGAALFFFSKIHQLTEKGQ